MDLHPDFSDLLAEFARYEVRYALLGGYAVGVYANARATKDLDLLISGEGDNLERVAAALAAFGAPRHVVEAARAMAPTEMYSWVSRRSVSTSYAPLMVSTPRMPCCE